MKNETPKQGLDSRLIAIDSGPTNIILSRFLKKSPIPPSRFKFVFSYRMHKFPQNFRRAWPFGSLDKIYNHRRPANVSKPNNCRSNFPLSPADGSALDKPVPKWHHIGMEQVLDEPRKRITARVSDSVRDTLEQAAELLGATVNQFVVQTAYVEAQRVIERESVIRLSQKDAHKILALLDNPPKPNKRLKDAVKTYKGTMRA